MGNGVWLGTRVRVGVGVPVGAGVDVDVELARTVARLVGPPGGGQGGSPGRPQVGGTGVAVHATGRPVLGSMHPRS